MSADWAFVEGVRGGLAELGDPARAVKQQAYMKSAMPYWGVAMAEVRATVRELLGVHVMADRAAWEATARALWDEAEHREEWYAALALLRHRRYREWLDPDLLPLAERLIRTGSWWDVCDETADHVVGPILLAHRASLTPVMTAWASTDHLWLRRVAMLSQNRHGEETDTELLGRALRANLEDTAYGRDFFIRKALGWALRCYARTDPDWVLDFVETHSARLSGLARREALKHLR